MRDHGNDTDASEKEKMSAQLHDISTEWLVE